VVQLNVFEETINWNAHGITDWSAERATNCVMDDGALLIDTLPKDYAYVLQCRQNVHMSYKIE